MQDAAFNGNTNFVRLLREKDEESDPDAVETMNPAFGGDSEEEAESSYTTPVAATAPNITEELTSRARRVSKAKKSAEAVAVEEDPELKALHAAASTKGQKALAAICFLLSGTGVATAWTFLQSGIGYFTSRPDLFPLGASFYPVLMATYNILSMYLLWFCFAWCSC